MEDVPNRIEPVCWDPDQSSSPTVGDGSRERLGNVNRQRRVCQSRGCRASQVAHQAQPMPINQWRAFAIAQSALHFPNFFTLRQLLAKF
jgi:hypothetical protein